MKQKQIYKYTIIRIFTINYFLYFNSLLFYRGTTLRLPHYTLHRSLPFEYFARIVPSVYRKSFNTVSSHFYFDSLPSKSSTLRNTPFNGFPFSLQTRPNRWIFFTLYKGHNALWFSYEFLKPSLLYLFTSYCSLAIL